MRVRFYAGLSDIVGQKEIEMKFSGSVHDLLGKLCGKYGDRLREAVFDDSGQVRKYLKFLVNGQNIEHLNGVLTELKDNDEMAVFLPIAGG
ncbi:MAG: MoaD family protein [Deltaproteobacteria bacterium]|nr:MoaD family protein [Deltaproteobacteria bacterium]